MKKITQIERSYARRWGKKIKAINMLSGKCSVCSEDDIFALEFHHFGEYKKDAEINDLLALNVKWSTLEKELVKCQLMCRNCHSEYHSPTNSLIKDVLLRMKGGAICEECGYAPSNISSLEFHHIGDFDKDFTLSKAYTVDRLRYKIEKIEKEMRKSNV